MLHISTLHLQTRRLSCDSVLCMIFPDSPLLLSVWGWALIMTPRWTQQNVEMKSDIYSWTTMAWWGKTGAEGERRGCTGKLDWKGERAKQHNVGETEINQNWEKEMIYCGEIESRVVWREREGERREGGGREGGGSEEKISCFLMGTDYISS